MSDIKISKPRLRLVVEHPDTEELVAIDVQTDNRDAVRFDLLRRSKPWPSIEDGPMLWMSVLGWSALKRSKLAPYDAIKVETFIDETLVDVVMIDEYGNPVETDAHGNIINPAQESNAVPTSPATDSA